MDEIKNAPIIDAEDVLYNYIISKEEGNVIAHEEIESLILVQNRTYQYYKIIKNTDKKLISNNRSLKSVKGKGYRLVGPEAIVDKAIKLMKTSVKKAGTAMTLINNIDKNSLNTEYRGKFDNIQRNFISMHANLSGGVKELTLLNNPKSKLLNGGKR